MFDGYLAVRKSLNTHWWSLATNIHKQYGVYFVSQKYSESFLIQYIFSIYLGLNLGPSDPEANYIPMCHCASLNNEILNII